MRGFTVPEKVPFIANGDGSNVIYNGDVTNDKGYVPTQGFVLDLDWKDNVPFDLTVEILGSNATRDGVLVKSADAAYAGSLFTIFLDDFLSAVQKRNVQDQRITGTWSFVRYGQRQELALRLAV